MDMRHLLSSRPALFQEGAQLVAKGMFWYQPFILADGFEVGEGQNLADNYRNCESLFDNNVSLAPQHRGLWDGNPRKLAADADYFSQCNQRYRLCYERIAETVASNVDLSSSSVMELGCNTGLTLFYLAQRGGARCVGIDGTDYRRQFRWLNKTLGTNVEFRRDDYNNIRHRLGRDPGQFDVVVNTVFLNHQSDPLHCLAYLADRARKGLFLWILLNDYQEMTVRYGDVSGVHDLGGRRRFPLTFGNDVTISKPLLLGALRQLGFGKVEFISPPSDPALTPPDGLTPFTMLYATRTSDARSALSSEPYRLRITRKIDKFDERWTSGIIRKIYRTISAKKR